MKKKFIRIVSLVLMLMLLATSNVGLFINANAASYTYSSLKSLPKGAMDRFIYLMETNKSMDMIYRNGSYGVCFKYGGNEYFIKESAFLPANACAGWNKGGSSYAVKMWQNGDVRINIMRVDTTVSRSGMKYTVKCTAAAALTITFDRFNMKLKLNSKTNSEMYVTPTVVVKTSNRAKIGVINGNGVSATGVASSPLIKKGDVYTFYAYTDKTITSALASYLTASTTVRATY